MKKRLCIRNHKSIWRVLASFFMACVLFVHAPLEARAASASNVGLNFSKYNFSGFADLEESLLESYTGSAMASLTYVGYATLRFSVGRASGTSWNYVSGRVWFPAAFEFTSVPAGNIESVSVSIDNVACPEGISVSMGGTTRATGTSVKPTVFVSFDEVPIYNMNEVSVTFRVQATRHFGKSVSTYFDPSLTYSVTPGDIGSSYIVYESFYDRGQKNQWVYNTANLLNSNLLAISSNLTTQSSNIQSKIGTESTNIRNKIQAQIDNDNSNTTKLQNTLNANSKAEIADADKNANAIINKLDADSKAEIANDNKNADDIMNSYDKSSQDTDNARFESSRAELQEQEDSLFSSAMEGFGSLDMSDYSFGKFSAMLSAFSFVSGFLQSCYVKMGDFGAIVTIGLVVMIATKVIGLYRFSTGGDSS